MNKSLVNKDEPFESRFLKQSAHKGISVFDEWMTKKADLEDSELSPGDLGFGQLNDCLLARYQPVFLREAEERFPEPADNRLLLRYPLLCASNEAFREFDVQGFLHEVQQKISLHIDIPSLVYADKAYLECLHQNLVMLVFSAERWSQQILGNEPGKAAKEILHVARDYSLHDYLQDCLGNYNTLKTFVLESVSGIDAIEHLSYGDGGFSTEKRVSHPSRYHEFDRIKGKVKQRFPSEMDLSAFPRLIKKAELVGHVYNEKLLTLNESVRLFGLDGAQSLKLCREVVALFRYATWLFTDFHRNPLFNDSKFIHVLRQFTVALEKCPATILFEDIDLDKKELIPVRGFVSHYLSRTSLDKREARLFVKQILLDEGIQKKKVYDCIDKWFVKNLPVRQEDFVCSQNTILMTPAKNLVAVCRELVNGGELGVARLRYTLNLVALKYPEVYKSLEPVVSVRWLLSKAHAIRTTNYQMVPSGANSVAYFGPDVVFGAAKNIPNYFIHMINRLHVMPVEDRHRFWALLNLSNNNIMGYLQQFADKADLPEDIREQLIANPWLADYVDLFESFAQLGRSHDATINKYVRRLDKKMSSEDKDKLITGPQTGTTFMLPNSLGVGTHLPELPSLEVFAASRSAHLFSGWVKPLITLRREKHLPPAVADMEEMPGFDHRMFAAEKSKV